MRIPASSKRLGLGSTLTRILGPRNGNGGGGGGPSDAPLLDQGAETSESPRVVRDATTTATTTATTDVENGGGRGRGRGGTPNDDRVVASSVEMTTTAGDGGEEEEKDDNDDDDDDDTRREKKLGHKFLFVCCDSKRAVVVLTSTMLILNSFVFASTILQNDSSMDGYARAMVMQGCGIFVTLCALLGAFWYSAWVVGVGLLYASYQIAMGIIRITGYDWSGDAGGGYNNEDGKLVVILPLVVNVLVFYAEAVYISEVNDGTISEETYKRRERYSCCCTRL